MESEMEHPICHRKLASHHAIRLLRLKPDDDQISPSDGSHLSYELTNFELDDRARFYALSYTWGPSRFQSESAEDDPPSTIECNGTLIQVHKNLYEALRELASVEPPDFESVGIKKNDRDELDNLEFPSFSRRDWFWVDAICVNQSDLAERHSQVKLMGKIYSSAVQVIVWLGSYASDMNSFIWAFQELYRKITRVADEKGYGYLQAKHIDDFDFNSKDLGLRNPRQKFREFLFLGARVRWFSRAWVLQEIAMASEIVVRCGKHSLLWKSMLYLWKGFEQAGWMTELEDSASPQQILASSRIRQMRLLRDICAPASEDYDQGALHDFVFNICGATAPKERALCWIYIMLSISTDFDCTLPGDKLFSIMAMASRVSQFEVTTILPPKYLRSPQQLSYDLVRLFLDYVANLSFLMFTESDPLNHRPDVPSWVPSIMSISPQNTVWIAAHIGASAAARKTQDPDSWKLRGYTLEVKGRRLDNVQKICRLDMEELYGTSNIIELLELCPDAQGAYADKENYASRLDAFWRAVIRDISMFGGVKQGPGLEMAESFRSYIMREATRYIHGRTDDADSRVERVEQVKDALSQCNALVELPSIEQVFENHQHVLQELELRKLESKTEGQVQLQNGYTKHFDKLNASCAPFSISSVGLPNRRVFTTEKGWFGSASRHVAVGDQIWSLKTGLGTARVILRPTSEGNYLFLSICHLSLKRLPYWLKEVEFQTIQLI